MPVYNPDAPGPSPGKRPFGTAWQIQARLDPPAAAAETPRGDALNTGILCDGLRAIDLDIDNPTLAQRCRAIAVEMFGEAPIRTRRNSPRCLILYRAAAGYPEKRVLAGALGKIEVLGHGQQFVAFGGHESGADLEWFPDAPGDETLESIPPVTEDDITAFFEACAPVINATVRHKAGNGADHAPSDPQTDPLRLAAELHAIPNVGPADWDWWNRIGMAVWAATGGSEIGWQAWDAWSARHPAYDRAETRKRWEHYPTSPPDRIGAGSIIHLAREARKAAPTAQSAEPAEPPAATQRLVDQFVWFRDIQPQIDVRDFVQGLLLERSSIVIYGQSNSGKTFWTTTLALHIAAGQPWHGRRVEQGGVIYCALEGGIGFSNRVAAWREETGFGSYDLPFAAIPAALNLLDPEADTVPLIDAVNQAKKRMAAPLRLIVIDTLARALAGGNENAPDDMGALVGNMDRIRAETGAAVAFVHHSGKDQAKGARGHSSLQAAIDTEIEVTADEFGEGRMATVVKQRELRKGEAFSFTLRTVELGQNRHGEPVTTCVVEAGEGHTAGAVTARRRLTGHNKRALEILANLVATAGRGGHSGVPGGYLSVPEKWWRDRFYDQAMPGAEDDAKKKAFRRAADALIESRRVGMADKRVWLTDARGPIQVAENGDTEV